MSLHESLYYARQISMQPATTTAAAATRIWQKLSFAVLPSVAAAIPARMPVQIDTQSLYSYSCY